MTIVPGFIDCHNHAPGEVLVYEVLVGNPYEVEFVSIASIIEKLRAKTKTPPGTWVEGYFFDDTKVMDKRLINVHDLDKVSNRHPVTVYHRGGDTSFYNSKAFEMADINQRSPNPPGGTFERDSSGALTGRVTDRARDAFNRLGKRPSYTPEQNTQRSSEGLAYSSKQFVKYGVTAVHHEEGDLAGLQVHRARGELLHRLSYECNGKVLEAMISSGIRSGFGDEGIKLGATSEHAIDGSFSERTMALRTSYPGVTPAYRGNVMETQAELDAWVKRVHRAGIQVNRHANGDLAIDMMLTAMERAQKAFPRTDTRPKITHCTMTPPALVQRIKNAGRSAGGVHHLRVLQLR